MVPKRRSWCLVADATLRQRCRSWLMADNKEKADDSAGELQVPKAVVSRLSLYLRELQHLIRDGHDTTSSTQLGRLLGFTDAQVRKDLRSEERRVGTSE